MGMARKPTKMRLAKLGLAATLLAGCQGGPDTPSQTGESCPRSIEVCHDPILGDAPSNFAGSAIQQVAAWSSAAASCPAEMKLGLSEAIETGLAQNPDLITLRQNEGVSHALLGVAQTYPFNPRVQTRILPLNKFPNGDDASTYNYVLLWQTFELAHQKHYRTRNAAEALENVRWTIHQAELLNAALTTQLYLTALYQRGLRDLSEATTRLNEEMLEVMESRLKAGQSAAADVATIRIDVRTSRQQAKLSSANYNNAQLALRRQLNVPPHVPLTLQGELTDYEWYAVNGAELCQLIGSEAVFTAEADRDQLAAELACRRPDVLAARAAARAGCANLGLARASQVPNVMFGPFYSRDSEAIVSVGFQAEMEIPVMNTGKPLVRQRFAELQQQRTAAAQLEARARIESRTALERYEQARLLCESSDRETQQQPEELKKLEEQFKKGEIDILRIVQARNSQLQFRRAHLDSLNELAQAAAAVTLATGLPPAVLLGPARAATNLP